jgi:hypothetical protein
LPLPRSYSLFEQHLREIKLLQKDPDPRVRDVALHVERDAYEHEAMETRLGGGLDAAFPKP